MKPLGDQGLLELAWAEINAIELVQAERIRQDNKWGEQNHDDTYWLAILVEEVGEVAKAICERDERDTFTETIEVAAVAVAWLECIQRRVRDRQ